jgi:hypothetical protein
MELTTHTDNPWEEGLEERPVNERITSVFQQRPDDLAALFDGARTAAIERRD